MRGSNTLFADIFETPVPTRLKKGRSSDLIALRNECLIQRYFYYGQQKIRYDVILEKVGTEFFVSVHTIPDIIANHVHDLKRMKDNPPSPKELQKKWPFLVW